MKVFWILKVWKVAGGKHIKSFFGHFEYRKKWKASTKKYKFSKIYNGNVSTLNTSIFQNIKLWIRFSKYVIGKYHLQKLFEFLRM